jgi:putative ABC transport system permease protein
MKGFGFLVKYSYANLWRSPKRTMIMILSLSLGTGFIIWNMNFASSGSTEVINKILVQYAGFEQITHPDFYSKKNHKEFNKFRIIKDSDIPELNTFIQSSTRRVVAPVFISGLHKTVGVQLTGIDVEKEAKLTTFNRAITSGRSLNPNASDEVVIGKKLADRIDVKIGDEISVIGQALDGSMANELLKVVGLFDFGGGGLEQALAFTQFSTAHDLMMMKPGTFHELVSFSPSKLGLTSTPKVRVLQWNEIMPELAVSVRFIDNFTLLISCIIVVVVTLGLGNTIMVMFFEREKEFQCLNVIGADSIWVATSIILEVFIIGTLAILLGVLVGYLFSQLFYHYPINIEIFSGGKPIIMGGMVIQPTVRVEAVAKYYWQVPALIYFFLALTTIYPLLRVLRRSSHAI